MFVALHILSTMWTAYTQWKKGAFLTAALPIQGELIPKRVFSGGTVLHLQIMERSLDYGCMYYVGGKQSCYCVSVELLWECGGRYWMDSTKPWFTFSVNVYFRINANVLSLMFVFCSLTAQKTLFVTLMTFPNFMRIAYKHGFWTEDISEVSYRKYCNELLLFGLMDFQMLYICDWADSTLYDALPLPNPK